MKRVVKWIGVVIALLVVALREINDTDVTALYAYLIQLPPRPAGGR